MPFITVASIDASADVGDGILHSQSPTTASLPRFGRVGGSAQEQYRQAATVEAVTAKDSAATGGSKIASAMASHGERW
jgi:hypothetical protein